MINQIYIENEIKDHPRVQRILKKFKRKTPIYIDKYASVFNKKNQNFRIQKKYPSLILAKKKAGHVLKTPSDFGIGNSNNFYFSHMYNCLYDCEYCFLQGMYSSADYVLFVNYEDFEDGIKEKINFHKNEKVTFFSGYDCDSLAFEKISGFVSYFLPFFKKFSNVEIELRTKSIQMEPLLKMEPVSNCIVAFSLLPAEIADKTDHKAPTIKKRINKISELASMGWKIGLRFDPLIHGENWKNIYKELFADVFKNIDKKAIHSITLGPLRFPKAMFKKILDMNPRSKLLSDVLVLRGNKISYTNEIELEMQSFCIDLLNQHSPETLFFSCKGNF